MLIHLYSSPSDNYIITAPNYKILKQSTLPAFEKVMAGIGRYQAVDSIYKIKGGPTVFLRTGTQADSIVGITNVRGIWGDEAGKYTLYFWENIQGRASFMDCPIMLTSSPYALNWMHKEIIKPKSKGLRPDITLIQARSDENPYFPKSEYENRKLTMDPRRFNMMYGGAWDKAEGLVYDCLDDDYNFVDPFELPLGTKYYGGIDWGHTDPFVIKIRAVTPFGDQFDVSEFYKTRMTVSAMMEVIRKKHEIFHVEKFFCDPSQPAYISELQQMKIPAYGANNSIQIGIDRHYELIKTRRLRIFKGHCPYTCDEYETYHYAEPQDLKPDQSKNERMSEPVDQSNHCFSGRMLVTTKKGDIPIKDIREGDEVLTRKGWKKVLIKWTNGEREVVTFIPVNGRAIECTSAHEFFIKGYGFKPLNAIRYMEKMYILTPWKKKLLSSGVLNIIDTLKARREQIEFISNLALRKVIDTCIGPFGYLRLAQSHQNTIFTIKMVTPSIIRLKILNALRPKNIWGGMRLLTKRISNLRKKGIGILNRLEIQQKNGIVPMLAADGTENMRRKRLSFSTKKISNQFASLVTTPFSPQLSLANLTETNSAQISVNLDLEENAASITFIENALDVRSHSLLINIPIGNGVVNANKKEVFDLTVEDAHEYFVNGVLVSNCLDAERYLSISLHKSEQMFTPIVPNEVKRAVSQAQRIERLKKRTQYYD